MLKTLTFYYDGFLRPGDTQQTMRANVRLLFGSIWFEYNVKLTRVIAVVSECSVK